MVPGSDIRRTELSLIIHVIVAVFWFHKNLKPFDVKSTASPAKIGHNEYLATGDIDKPVKFARTKNLNSFTR